MQFFLLTSQLDGNFNRVSLFCFEKQKMMTRLKATLPKKNEILILSSENCFALKPLVEVI